MSPADTESLIAILQKHTPLIRLSFAEARATLLLMQDFGYVITPPVAASA